jgi:hypothetical protein
MLPGGRLHEIWVGERCFSVSPAEFLTWFFFVLISFFGVRSAHFGWFFQDTHLSTMVAGFFQSNSLQPRPCRFFTLGAWPTRTREVTPGSTRVGHTLSSRMRLEVLRWFWGLLADFFLWRSPVAMRVLHTLMSGTVLSDAGLVFGFCFGLFLLFFLIFSQFVSVMLKCYWTICWLTCYICSLLFVDCV